MLKEKTDISYSYRENSDTVSTYGFVVRK